MITFTFVLQISAQEKVKEIPLVYSLSTVHLPDFEDLPVIETLPDPFAWSDGSGRQNAYGRLSADTNVEIHPYSNEKVALWMDW